MKPKEKELFLKNTFYALMDADTLMYIKQLKADNENNFSELYLKLVATYPKFKIDDKRFKIIKSKNTEGKAAYKAALTYYQNTTRQKDWERW